MIPIRQNYFPEQRVSNSTKHTPEWYANCIDYVIDAGIAHNNREDDELKLNILHGNIPDDFYKKTLNPYNSSNEKYVRFPATMRNLDIMTDIVRRYVSEYFKGVHEFVVGANNPDVIINKDAKLAAAIREQAIKTFQAEFEKQYQAAVQETIQNGQDPNQINPQDVMPDIEEFINNFNKNYIDKESKQGQDVLNYVRSVTDDVVIYLTSFFNFVTLGQAFTYCDVRGNKIIKECIPTIEAFPVPNSNFFVEDHDMFARRMMMSYQQIMDSFGDFLEEKDRKFLESHYANQTSTTSPKLIGYEQYFETYPELCTKFTNKERELFRKEPVSLVQANTNLIEVWHVVWRGEARVGILTYVNEVGFNTTRVVEDGYEINPEIGDLNIEWEYVPQVYEGYRIGNRYTSIYPVKARPVAFNRKGKLPYNGILEVLPMMGKFSIVKIVTPYQVLRNIISYHREMVIAKNKMLILLLPESLVASDTEDRIYKMAADGTLLIDDSEDSNMIKAQQIRLLNANLGDYIAQLTNLMESIKLEAREMVDMNSQRYGDIAQSAGVGTTQEAISRSSMGMVILVQMFDEFRKRDYNRDLDYAKLAYIDGLDTSYWNELGQKVYISMNVDSFINSDYSTTVRNDSKEIDKLQQLKQWAFSAAQNGELDMAIAAISGDNVTQIKATVEEFMAIKRQHEEQMKQTEQMIEQAKIDNKLKEIAAKGEQDRLTEQLKQQYALQLKYVDVDVSMLGSGEDTGVKNRLTEMSEENRRNIEEMRIQLERDKLMAESYNKAADRQVKREDIQAKIQIAKENKNKYDK